MTQKPYASLTNAQVLDIVNELDSKIEDARTNKDLFNVSDTGYSMYLCKEIAYMDCRNLILSKL